MTSHCLQLAPFDLDNFDTLASWIADERAQAIWSASTFPYPLTREDLEDHLTLCRSDGPHRELLMALDPDSGEMVGVFSLKRVDSLGRTGHLSMIMVSPEVRGKGVGAAMVKAALKRGFDIKGFRRMQLYVFDFNTAAKTCYSACGLINEGPGNVPMNYKGETWTVEVMGVSKNQVTGDR